MKVSNLAWYFLPWSALIGGILGYFFVTQGLFRVPNYPPARLSQSANPRPEPVSYCRAGWNIAVPEAGPNKAVIAFAPCVHVKGERSV